MVRRRARIVEQSTDGRIEQCDPAVVYLLVEELLDSQTLDGCRVVLDYLEPRRQRMTAVCIPSMFITGQGRGWS